MGRAAHGPLGRARPLPLRQPQEVALIREIFADTGYWLGLVNPRDQWHPSAVAATARIAGGKILTTQEVLIELLNAMSSRGPEARSAGLKVVSIVERRSDIEVLPQSAASFSAGLALYEARGDKGYSLTDCISMAAMRARGISEVLSNDQHFPQEGFELRM